MKNLLITKSCEIAVDLMDKGKYSLIASPVIIFLQKYIFADVEFLKWLVVLMVLDTVLGFVTAFKRKEVDPEKFGDILLKILVYGSCLIVGHVLENFTVSGSTIPGGQYMKMLIYVSILVKEAISIFKNLGKISKNFVPKSILKRLKAFDNSGDFKDLTDEQRDPKKNNASGDDEQY